MIIGLGVLFGTGRFLRVGAGWRRGGSLCAIVCVIGCAPTSLWIYADCAALISYAGMNST